MKHASKEWMDQFKVGGGSVAITCSCTRTHVAIESHDFEDGERARYEAAAKNNPKAYVLHHGIDSVSEHTINGLTIVDECECGTMARFEQFVIRERDFILGYYRAIADKAAKQAAEIGEGLANIVPTNGGIG